MLDKLKRIVEMLDLDLKGARVLTEAATGAYSVTPILAALSGAEVYAYAKSSRYASVEEAISTVLDLADASSVYIHPVQSLDQSVLSQVDLVTNSGHLRPLNQSMLQHLKKGAVISYMYEKWEYRESDLDLGYCREFGIRVAATNERHPKLAVFDYLGELAIRLLHQSNVALTHNRLILISNNAFGPYIAKVIAPLCLELGVVDVLEQKAAYAESENSVFLSAFPTVDIPDRFSDTEAILFTAYPFDQAWFGVGQPLNPSCFSKLSRPKLLRFCGDIDTANCDRYGVRYFPECVASGHMGVLLSDISYDPIIRLQAGGLRVGQALLNREYTHSMLEMMV